MVIKQLKLEVTVSFNNSQLILILRLPYYLQIFIRQQFNVSVIMFMMGKSIFMHVWICDKWVDGRSFLNDVCCGMKAMT